MSDKIQTGKWLAERQTFLEGFNGRPEKLLNVSYFYSVLNNIFIIGGEDLFDKDLLIKLFLNIKMMNREVLVILILCYLKNKK